MSAARGLDAGITGWNRVSGRLVAVRLVQTALGALVGVVIGTAVLLLLDGLWVGWAVIAVAVVLAAIDMVLTARGVRAIGWVLREDDLVVRRGLLLSRVVAVPYGRMQLVDVNRGPIAQLLGLAELRLVTAAAASDVTLPGLPAAAAEQLRDALVARAEERRVGL